MPDTKEECAVLLERPSKMNLTLDGQSYGLQKSTGFAEDPQLFQNTKTARKDRVDPTTGNHKSWDLQSTTGTTSFCGGWDPRPTVSTTSIHGNWDVDRTKSTTSIHGNWDADRTKSTTSIHGNWDVGSTKSTTSMHSVWSLDPTTGIVGTHGSQDSDPITGTSGADKSWDPNARFVVGEEGQLFVGNKNKMAAVSPIFEAMFRGRWTEDKDIHIPDVRAEAFRMLLRYADTGTTDQLNQHNVWHVLKVADKYQVAPLVRRCFHHLLHCHPHRRHPQHLCVVMETAHHLHYRNEYSQCVEQVLKQAGKVLTDMSCLLQLCHDCLLTIVRSDHLQGVGDEVVIYKAVLAWTTARCGQRASWKDLRHIAGDLLYQVRYLTLPTPTLTRLLEASPSSALLGDSLSSGRPGSPESHGLLESSESPSELEDSTTSVLLQDSPIPSLLENPKPQVLLKSPKPQSLLQCPQCQGLLKSQSLPCLLTKEEVDDLLHHHGSRFPASVGERRNQTQVKAEGGAKVKKSWDMSRRWKYTLWCTLICLILLITFVIQYFLITFLVVPVTQMMQADYDKPACTNHTHCG